ncbi:MAG TPA: MATE family efflux transporter, partial [Candidatus Acidoferrales bacterium]|nr:MATE family efflux transporter [Candidatus Acidoferrales bacterium]
MQRARGGLDETRPVWRTLLAFLIPMMLTNVLQSANGTINSIFLGRMIGVHALAAASAFFPVLFLIFAFFIGLSSGASVLIGQAHGARNDERLREVAGTTLMAALVLSVILGLAGWFSIEPLLRVLRTPADIFHDAASYARVIFAGLPVMLGFLSYTAFARGTGDAQTPFWALVVSTLSSLLVTPALIAGWFGLPHLGILSAAVAGIVSNIIGWLFILWAMHRKQSSLALTSSLIPHIRIRWQILAMTMRLGVATGVQVIMVSLAEIAVLSFVNHFGSQATAAYGAVNQIVSYAQFPAISIGIAASIFGAQAIGARRVHRLGEIVRSSVILNYLVEGGLIAIVYLASPLILGLFLTDQPTLRLAHSLLMITLWSYVIFGNSAVLSG